MAVTKTTQMSNRYGLDVTVYAATDTTMTTPLITIPFANISEINISADRTWATGGQTHSNKIGFNNPIQGTLKLSTQIMTADLLNVMAGGTAGSGTTSVVFQDAVNSMPKYYILKATTVWQDEVGGVYDETLTFHKACPKIALNISYSGDGEPTSCDIEFDLLANGSNQVMTSARADHT